ncbi:DUF1501 domain-containing protein [Piscinibacter sakaiensis]|uniref:DUF1501 domain-containing protein n=1 Tax=Piscinibacter sakaiensis TaxID=1547922 RepID=UPI003AAC91CA
MSHNNQSRRQFLRAASGLAAAAAGQGIHRFSAPLAMSLAGMATLASQSSSAATVTGPYRALVCLFMAGGNDSHNWVVPMDAIGYGQYAAVRRELAWPLANLQQITSTTQEAGRVFGMPAELQPLRQWYEAGRAAIVANVGPLKRPITKAEFLAGTDVPSKLFSHNDQQSTWQSLSPEGARSGWGGRMGDILMSANQQPMFTAVSAAGNAVFLSGSTVTQYQVGANGPVKARALGNSWVHGSSTAGNVLRNTLAANGDTALQSEYTRVMQRSIAADAMLQTALASGNVPAIPSSQVSPGNTATLDNDSLAKQLRMVTQMIAAGQTLGMRRQVFMVSIGGFDTHANQMRDQPVLMARVAQSVNYFLSSLNTMGMLNNVTLFTASDFGRTLTTNGDGSDHGWGSHHFIAGGGVRGATIHGRFPTTALGTSEEVGSGRLLPGISVAELAGNLGGWMGLSRAEQEMVLPDLAAFGARLPPMMWA